MQSMRTSFNGSVGFGKRVTLNVPRTGDLMHSVFLNAQIPAIQATANDGNVGIAWASEIGNYMIDYVEVLIGGQIIDKHYGYWLHIWASLTLDAGKQIGYRDMVNGNALNYSESAAKESFEVFVPLQFWFCRHEGLALPLIALQYHNISFVLEFKPLASLVQNSSFLETGSNDLQADLYINYIFLDTEERRKFAQTSHEYLIEQVQFTGDETIPLNVSVSKINMNFNHPVKELIWIILGESNNYIDDDDHKDNRLYDTATFGTFDNPLQSCKIQFNGHDRFTEMSGNYFSKVQPYYHHTNIPLRNGINCYSFALYPELEQPSGSSNFSRIDQATMHLTLTPEATAEVTGHTVKLYAINYNVLRIMSGMGGLAYSN
jgi:hypothetical protein